MRVHAPFRRANLFCVATDMAVSVRDKALTVLTEIRTDDEMCLEAPDHFGLIPTLNYTSAKRKYSKNQVTCIHTGTVHGRIPFI